VESQALYNILENELVPCFYDRKNGDVPAFWLEKMKASMKMAMEKFCSMRMVTDYVEKLYGPAASWYDRLVADGAAVSKQLAAQQERVLRLWKGIQVGSPTREIRGVQRVGDSFRVTAEVSLGELRPEDVDIELYYGAYKSFSEVTSSRIVPMQMLEGRSDGRYLYECWLACDAAGRFGFSVRATPHGDAWIKLTPGLITWASE
jgi:starch phosphorylase